MIRLLLLVIFLLASCSVHAHKPSDSYLTLSVTGDRIAGQWDIALRDLDYAIGLDANGDAEITWGEVRAKHGDIAAYALSRLALTANGRSCGTRVVDHLIDEHTDGAYAVLRFEADCAQEIQTLQAHYRLFFDIDPQHKGLLRLAYDENASSAVFSPENAAQQFVLERPDRFAEFVDFLREGVWHIWIGYDHILFLLALLLPAVLVRRRGRWQPVDAFTPAFWSVFKIVTAFTVAHSVTLSLATLGVVGMPSRLVESTIAASVALAAMNNIFPLFHERRWTMAFAFGLVHGFGFASVLSDLGLPQNSLMLALVAFNVGVEAGQLAIVAAFLPAAFVIRRTLVYRRLVLLGGSLAIAILAAVWLVERTFDLKLVPF